MNKAKRGDTHPLTWEVNTDLTGATVRLLARPKPKSGLPDVTIPLAATVTNAVEGEITHTLTGTLEVGEYSIEAEVTRGGEIMTFPAEGFDTLRINQDLG